VNDLENSLFLKKDLLFDDVIKQTDITTLDNSIFDVYKMMIKVDKNQLMETKNKQLYEISPKKISILKIRTYAEANIFEPITNIANNLRPSSLTPLQLAELYIDYKQFPKAVDQIKKIMEEDYFDYKLTMLKYIE